MSENTCTRPPPGWHCTLGKHDDGPCAAIRQIDRPFDEGGDNPGPPIPEFQEFQSISRYNTVTVTVTEKIDGQNVHIFVPDDPAVPLICASRTRYITPEQDMSGFAAFVRDNAESLRWLGSGRHYGEWWGRKIQRTYGLEERRLSLFNHRRFDKRGLPAGLPGNVSLVPILYQGPVDSRAIAKATADLFTNGSSAMPGYMQPEGVVIEMAGLMWKVSDHGDVKKGREHHLRALLDQIELHKSAADGRIVNRLVDDLGGDWYGDLGHERQLADLVLEVNAKERLLKLAGGSQP